MELVNFAREDLGTVVTSSCVFDDNHPPSNLIATKQSLRSAGYRAEHFIRPPVTLHLQFAAPINIHSVCIQLNQLPIHTTTAVLYLPRAMHPVKICSDIILKGNAVIQLINRGSSLGDLITPQTALGSFLQLEKEEGKLNNSCMLNGVNSLEMKIVSSSSYQAPAVKAFEVWGLFDKRCKSDVIQKFMGVVESWKQQSDRNTAPFVPSLYSAGTQQPSNHNPTLVSTQFTKSQANNSGQSSSGQIPDGFLDEITYEVMLVPMLLPSGHYVDQTTIDKFCSAENIWGRPNADPFTGVPFTSTVKPKFCTHLKVQIDEFLSKNNQQFANIGRTVGNSNQLEKHLISRKHPVTNIYVGQNDGHADCNDMQPKRKKPC